MKNLVYLLKSKFKLILRINTLETALSIAISENSLLRMRIKNLTNDLELLQREFNEKLNNQRFKMLGQAQAINFQLSEIRRLEDEILNK